MRLIRQLADEQDMSRPLRLRIEFSDPGDLIDVPFRLASGPASPAVPSPRKPTGEQDRGPTTIGEAICLALFLKDQRLTSGQLIADVQERWGDRGWDDSSIGVEASRMVRAGTLLNFREDVRDGRGKGYSLVDWSPPEAENTGG